MTYDHTQKSLIYLTCDCTGGRCVTDDPASS